MISFDLLLCLMFMGAGYVLYVGFIKEFSKDILSNNLKYRDFVVLLLLVPITIFWIGMLTAEALMVFFTDNGVILTDFQQASCLVSGFVSGFITVPALSVITIIIQAISRRLKRKSEPVDEWEQALKEGRRIR